jgi:hypothetical protein
MRRNKGNLRMRERLKVKLDVTALGNHNSNDNRGSVARKKPLMYGGGKLPS